MKLPDLAGSPSRSINITSPLGPQALLFHSVEGREALGQPFEYTVRALSKLPSIELESLLGKSVTLDIELQNAGKRYLNGLVTRFEHAGRHGRYHHYTLVLRPWLWLLTLTRDCKIFQRQSIPQIVQAVFADCPVSVCEARLAETYPTLDYVVQYRETDLDFVLRLMQHAGIYFFFEHEDRAHRLVMCDAPSAHKPCLGYETVPYESPDSDFPAGLGSKRECFTSWRIGKSMQSGSVVLNDYDFRRPQVDIRSTAVQPLPHEHAQGEIYDHPGTYASETEGEHYVRVRLEELHAQHERAQCESCVRGLITGSTFTLSEHPRPEQNREYLIVAVRWRITEADHETHGDAGQGFSVWNEVDAMPTLRVYRPPMTIEKPYIFGLQTAVVVGPPGQEIHPDAFGRVKVQFHWDRYGGRDDKSSCWLRVASSWAGKGSGMLSIPRVGQEVVVQFMEGDPDRPLITGSLYNGDNRPPWSVPQAAHQSGLRSSSTPGGNGFCEVTIHDKAGEELLNIHSQKDMVTTVQNDHTLVVNGPRHAVSVTRGKMETQVQEELRLASLGNEIHLSAATKITLECGDSKLTMDKDGTITIEGKTISSIASAGHTIKGEKLFLNP